MKEIYAWVMADPREDGKEGIVGAIAVSAFEPSGGGEPVAGRIIPLVTRSYELAVGAFRTMAEEHTKNSGVPTRLLRFGCVEEVMLPDGNVH